MENGGERRWTARDRAVTARMARYLSKSERLEVEIEEPEEFEVDVRHIAVEARGEKHRRLLHAFSVQGLSDFSVTAWRDGMCTQACLGYPSKSAKNSARPSKT